MLTGALFACDRKLDIIGTVVLGLVTGYGGGIIRDMLLQTHGVYFTSHPDLILICIAICTFVFYFRGLFRHLDATVFFADALSVGLFALAGASKAFSLEQGFVLSVILGAITAVGGGAVRDICVGETPGIFQQSNFYAVAGLGGSFAFVALAYAGSPLPLAGVACVFVVVFLRYWSVYFPPSRGDTLKMRAGASPGAFPSAILSALTMRRAMPCQGRRGGRYEGS